MRYAHIIFSIGWGGVMLSFLMLFPLVFSVFTGHMDDMIRFSVSILISIFFSITCFLSVKNIQQDYIHKFELFLFVTVLLLVLPILAAIPFLDEEVHFWASYFEAVSGLTTTGATIYTNPEYKSDALLLWRALLGWFGGLLTLGFSIAIISPLGLFGVNIKSLNIRQSEKESLPKRLYRTLQLICPIYTLISITAIVLMWSTGTSFINAVILSLSAVSTTGFSVSSVELSSFISDFSLIIMALFMFIGALSYPLLLAIQKMNLSHFNKDDEFFHFIQLLFLMILGFSLFNLTDFNLIHSLLTVLNLMTTSAFNIYPDIMDINGLSIFLILIPVIIGGMSLSTSGGLKVLRVFLLFKHITYEIIKLPYLNVVTRIKYRQNKIGKDHMTHVVIFFMIFLFVFGFCFFITGLLTNNFEEAWIMSAAMLSNSGGIGTIIGYPHLFSDLSPIGYIFFSFMMIIARLEFLIVLILFYPIYWRSTN